MVTVNPDCRDGKHQSCSGMGWDESEDIPAVCPCPCHAAENGGIQTKGEVMSEAVETPVEETPEAMDETGRFLPVLFYKGQDQFQLGDAYVTQVEGQFVVQVVLNTPQGQDVGEVLFAEMVKGITLNLAVDKNLMPNHTN